MSETNARHDDGAGTLAILGVHEPDRARGARVRERCRAVLQKRRPRSSSPARSDLRRSLEPAIVGCLCAVYLLEVLSRAVHFYRF